MNERTIIVEGKPIKLTQEEFLMMEHYGMILQQGQENHYVVTPIYRRIMLERANEQPKSTTS